MKFMLDSGAHSLYTKYVIKEQHRNNYDFYDSKKFLDFVDGYAKFVMENEKDIDRYVNVDIIFNPKKSLEIQKFMEKEYNLKPMPVLHYGEDLKYLDIYIDMGYDYIGIGGLGQEVTKSRFLVWGDKVFQRICNKEGKSKIKTHGFAMTSIELLMRYPWVSVDSSSWIKAAFYGNILVPLFKNGGFEWLSPPKFISVSDIAFKKEFKKHYDFMHKHKKEIIDLYLKEMGYKMGITKYDKDGKRIVIEEGIRNSHCQRSLLNISYFMAVQRELNNNFNRKFPFLKINERRLF